MPWSYRLAMVLAVAAAWILDPPNQATMIFGSVGVFALLAFGELLRSDPASAPHTFRARAPQSAG